MVLAAGLGVRMRPLSRLMAKPVLPVLNRPLLHWTLEALARHGVSEVVINLHHLPASVRGAVGDGRRFGLALRWSYERRVLGTAGGPRRVREFFGDAPFLLVNGDVLFDFDLTRLLARHRAAGAQATLALKPNPDPRRYGPVVSGPHGWVRSLAGRPRRARGVVSLFTGVHVLDPALLDRLPAGRSDSVRDLYPPLVEEGKLLGVRVGGPWYDLGSPPQYLASQLSMLASGFRELPSNALVHPTARIHEGARVLRSIVGARTIVEEGATLVDSVVWDRARVARRARVRRSILTTRAVVSEEEQLDDSILAAPKSGMSLGRWPLERES